MSAEQIKKDYDSRKGKYILIDNYYKGKTDAIVNYKSTDRSNLKVNCNYLKKFVKEETSYSVGNPISYSSKSNNQDAIANYDTISEVFRENHDTELFRAMVLFGIAYEIYYIDAKGNVNIKIVKPTEGWHEEDDDGNIIGFLRQFTKVVGDEVKTFYDYYTAEEIQHLDENLEVINEPTINVFSTIPVSVAKLSEDLWEDTLFTDIKGLQDALETILSDATNEISDFRNAYLVTVGLMFDEEGENTAEKMKERGILSIDGDEGKVEWLIKNINDTFIQNTVKTLVEKLYELTSHINHNDSIATSNASGVALKSRLISLMQRCLFNQNAYKELLKCRLEIIFDYMRIKNLGVYDWKDIKIIFTPCIPSDDGQIADLITKLDGRVSMQTLLSLLSFIENPIEEIDKVKQEQDTVYNGGIDE